MPEPAPRPSCSTAPGLTPRRNLRPAAGLSLRAHLGKLAEEGRLPEGLEAGLLA